MSNHLSQDQLSMWILGRSTPEELQHGRECPECSRELARFHTPVSTFRAVMQDWSDRENVPRLADVSVFLSRRGRPFSPVWRWVPAGLAVLILAAIPIYVQQKKLQQSEAEQATREDVLLMDAVNAHLSRTIPAPMEPIFVLVPGQESIIQPGDTQ